MSNGFTPTQPSLQLPSEILEIGDDKQLSASLVQQFDTASTHLNTWLSSQAESEKNEACRQIKGFLVSLNVYSRLPLGFRLQVLNELADVYKTCDADPPSRHADLLSAGSCPPARRLCPLSPIHCHTYSEPGYKFLLPLSPRPQNTGHKIDRPAMHLASTEFHSDADQEDASMTELKQAISRHEFIRKLDFFGNPGKFRNTYGLMYTGWQKALTHNASTLVNL